MARFPLRIVAMLFAWLVIVPAGAQESAADSALAEHLALPFNSGLVGAREVPRFAWIENRAGVRNIWVGGEALPGRRRTSFDTDDGIEISGLALSPDGERLAFVRGGDAEFPEGSLPNTGVATEAPRQMLFVLEVAGSGAPRAVGPGHGAVFGPDGAMLAFTRDGEIFVWSGEGGARRLAKLTGDVTDLTWSPDGRRLLFREGRPGRSFVALLDLEAGSLRYLGPALGYSSDPVFSPDGREIAFIQSRAPLAAQRDSSASFWSLRIADVESGAVRTVWTAPEGEGGRFYGTRGNNLFWTAAGDLLFPWERSGWLHVYAVPATGGGIARDLTPNANEVENFTLAPDGEALVYSANAGNLDTRQLWSVPVRGGETRRLTPDSIFAFFPVFGAETLAATVTDVRRPAHMVLVEGMRPLGGTEAVRSYDAPETVVFTAADGVEVHGQLFRGRGEGKRPALVFVHGGPRRQMLPAFHPLYYYHNAYVRNQEFAAQGYTVLSVNYRGGTNYGRAFREAANTGREGASEYRDVLAGGEWLAARAGVDSRRIGIWGGSWGGYLAALALARDSNLFAAGADFHGVHAMVRPVDSSYSPDEVAAVQQRQWLSSPMGAIATWRSPVLIVHGDDDRNVGFDQSLLLARALTARGVYFEELVFPNERHDFFRYADWLTSYRATGDFFDRMLAQETTQ